MKCKVFIRKGKKFEAAGFFSVVVKNKEGTKVILIFDGNKEILCSPVERSSIRSVPNSKEIVFVDATSTVLYKIKVADVKDTAAFREACK